MPKQTTGTPPRKRAPRKTTLTAVPTPANGDHTAASNGGKTQPTITFLGREIAVTRPEPEALSVWNRTGPKLKEAWRRLQELKESAADEAVIEQAETRLMNLADRMPIIIQSVMVHEADRDWLDDRFLTGLRYDQAADIVSMAIDQFRDPEPTAPTTGPVRRARLRA